MRESSCNVKIVRFDENQRPYVVQERVEVEDMSSALHGAGLCKKLWKTG